jgi:hypothetical protein
MPQGESIVEIPRAVSTKLKRTRNGNSATGEASVAGSSRAEVSRETIKNDVISKSLG